MTTTMRQTALAAIAAQYAHEFAAANRIYAHLVDLTAKKSARGDDLDAASDALATATDALAAAVTAGVGIYSAAVTYAARFESRSRAVNDYYDTAGDVSAIETALDIALSRALAARHDLSAATRAADRSDTPVMAAAS